MPIKAKNTKTTKKATTWPNPNWIRQFNNHLSSNATSFGWTKAQVNAFCQAFAAWEKAFNSLSNGNGSSKKSAKPVRKSSVTKSVKPKTNVKKSSSTKRNWKSTSRNIKIAA